MGLIPNASVLVYNLINRKPYLLSGLFPAILVKGSWPKLGKNDPLNSKLGSN